MDAAVKENWKWAEQFERYAKIITWRELSMRLMRIMESTAWRDLKEATDFRLEGVDCNVACRIRRRQCIARDLTIRSRLSSGNPTEIDKLANVNYYFYGWQHPNREIIGDWILIDVQALLKSEALKRAKEECNRYREGNFFKVLPIKQLHFWAGVVITSRTDTRRACLNCNEEPDWLLPDNLCVRCAMAQQEEDDRRRWEKAGGESAREKCRREAQEFFE